MSKKLPNLLLPVGIDPSRDTLGVALLHPSLDQVLEELIIQNRAPLDAQKLLDRAHFWAKQFCTQPVFILEATNVFWRPMASWLKVQGELVHVVSSKQTHANRSTGMRKTKTDTIDAALIARLYKQGQSAVPYLPGEPYMSLRELSRLNAFVVDLRARLRKRTLTVLYQIHPLWEDCFAHPFTKASLELMRREWVHPQKLLAAPDHELADVLKDASHGHMGKVFAESLKALSQGLFFVREGEDGYSYALKCLAEADIALEGVLTMIEGKLIRLLQSLPAQLLQTIPGMSPLTTASFLGELGDHERFASADKAVAWFGFDPAIAQSGTDDGQGRRMSKAGTRYGRRTMYLATLAFIRAVPQARKKFKHLIRAGRAKREAVCIMAADLIKICVAMLKSQSQFDPKKV